MIKVIHPDERTVSEATVRGWLADVIANGEVNGGLIDPNKEDIDHVIEALMDTGRITFATKKEYKDEV